MRGYYNNYVKEQKSDILDTLCGRANWEPEGSDDRNAGGVNSFL